MSVLAASQLASLISSGPWDPRNVWSCGSGEFPCGEECRPFCMLWRRWTEALRRPSR